MKNEHKILEKIIDDLKEMEKRGIELTMKGVIELLENCIPEKQIKVEKTFEVDKTYKLTFQTGGLFTIKEIVKNGKGVIVRFNGIYEDKPGLGICPLNADLLIP